MRTEYLSRLDGAPTPYAARLDEFIAAVVSGDHAGAIERYYTEDASMQENAAAPRVGRDLLVAHERAVLERVESVAPPRCVGRRGRSCRDQLGVHEFVYKSGKTVGSTRSLSRNGAATGCFASGSFTIREARPSA